MYIHHFFQNFVLILLIKNVYNTANKKGLSCDESLKSGIQAYLDQRWSECIDQFEMAVHIQKLTLSTIANCRLKCRDQPIQLLVARDIENLQFYEKLIKQTQCLIKCHRQSFKELNIAGNTSQETANKIKSLLPYEYLHMCYYQMNMLQQAASAAFTHFLKHPDDKMMKKNLEYYLGLPEVDAVELVNLEAYDFEMHFIDGVTAYGKEEWDTVIANMEESLKAYYSSENVCRMLCEGSFDQGWLPDFVMSTANHFTYTLQCKQDCENDLKVFKGTAGKDLLAEHYNYLQLSYYKVGSLSKASQAVASYLLIHPDDESMIDNKKFYLTLVDEDEFEPRIDISEYLRRDNYERKLLQYVNKQFKNSLLQSELEQSSNKN